MELLLPFGGFCCITAVEGKKTAVRQPEAAKRESAATCCPLGASHSDAGTDSTGMSLFCFLNKMYGLNDSVIINRKRIESVTMLCLKWQTSNIHPLLFS